jgi:hypothetical protein
MVCTLRKPERKETPPVAAGQSRLDRLKFLLLSGEWANKDGTVLIYWSPNDNGGRWVAWDDSPAPTVDPLPAAGVNIGA